MSFQAMAKVVDIHIHYREKSVLFVLANYADDQNKCYPSKERIAREAGMSKRTVDRSIDELVKAGIVKYEKGGINSGNNIYLLNLEGGCHSDRVSESHGGVSDSQKGGVTVTHKPIIEPINNLSLSNAHEEYSNEGQQTEPQTYAMYDNWEPSQTFFEILKAYRIDQTKYDNDVLDSFKLHWTGQSGKIGSRNTWERKLADWVKKQRPQGGQNAGNKNTGKFGLSDFLDKFDD